MDPDSSVGERRPGLVVAVLAILVIGLAFPQLSRLVGEDTHAGSMVALGGIVLCLAIVWATQRRLKDGWQGIGLGRPKAWPRTVGLGILVAVTSIAVINAFIALVVVPLSGAEPDVSRFDSARTSLAVTVATIFTVWLTSAIPEEIIWRGFLLTHLARLSGGGRLAWSLWLVLLSVHFGLVHYYQGASGMVSTGLAGLAYGVAFLLFGRNLWVPIVAHATSHLLGFTALYLGLL